MLLGLTPASKSLLVGGLFLPDLHFFALAYALSRGARLSILASALLPFRFFVPEALLGCVGFVITVLALRVLGVPEADALLLVVARWASLWV